MYSFFMAVGIYAVAYYLYDNLRTPLLLLYHKWQQCNKQHQLILMKKYGKWAAVTGATDGIGKAYARQLACLGFNIVLISRTHSKLKEVSKEIETEFGVETFIVQCDFSQGPNIYNNLYNMLSEKPIGILINNVGVGHNPPGTINTFSPDHIWRMININIGAATLLSRFFIKMWQKRQVKGHIVNISSGLGLQPCPFGSVYGASKAYMHSFTLALQDETKKLGITVQLLSPNFVITKINSYSTPVMKGNIFIPKPDKYAKWAVSTLGMVDETTGYFWHGVQNAILKILPWRLRKHLLMILAPLVVDNLNDVANHHKSNTSET